MLTDKTSLGDRMKGYEKVSRNSLVKRMPVVLRIDGKVFHTFCRGFKKPFDPIMVESMEKTMLYLCQNIQNCVFGYTQSDEITLVLVDYKDINTETWFDNSIQKICSIAASMATMAFNSIYKELVTNDLLSKFNDNFALDESPYFVRNSSNNSNKMFKEAMFDCRVFNVPTNDVCNCLIWRQQDATRNSIQSVGQANFSHKQLHKKSCDEIQEMLFSEKGINWNNLETYLKRGTCCFKKYQTVNGIQRKKWFVDKNSPIFSDDRKYVEKHILLGDSL